MVVVVAVVVVVVVVVAVVVVVVVAVVVVVTGWAVTTHLPTQITQGIIVMIDSSFSCSPRNNER